MISHYARVRSNPRVKKCVSRIDNLDNLDKFSTATRENRTYWTTFLKPLLDSSPNVPITIPNVPINSYKYTSL